LQGYAIIISELTLCCKQSNIGIVYHDFNILINILQYVRKKHTNQHHSFITNDISLGNKE